MRDKHFNKYGVCCVGAIDGTHIRISPRGDAERAACYDYKKNFSMTMLAVAVPDGRFLFAQAGFAGRKHDAGCLIDSNLYRRQTELSPEQRPLQDNLCIVGDAAFPLSGWLIKGFGVLDDPSPEVATRRRFDIALSRFRCCVERAFGSLKSRSRILQSGTRLSLDASADLATPLVLLHNWILRQRAEAGETFEDEEASDDPDGLAGDVGEDGSALVPSEAGLQARAYVFERFLEWEGMAN